MEFDKKMVSDEVLVDLVKDAEVIWKRNHPHFKNLHIKEQAWNHVAAKLGISVSDAERRFKSIREKYRRRKILLEREQQNNVANTKLTKWDIYEKLGFLDDFMIPRNGHNQSVGDILNMPYYKSDSSSNENITSTNNGFDTKNFTVKTSSPLNSSINTPPYRIGNVVIKSVNSLSSTGHSDGHNPVSSNMPHLHNNSIDARSISSTAPSTPSNIHNYESDQFDPIVKMEVPDSDNENDDVGNANKQPSEYQKMSQQNTNDWKYVGDFISNELSKLPPRQACALKNILIREVLKFSESHLMNGNSYDNN